MNSPFDTWLSVNLGAIALAIVWAAVWCVPALVRRRNDIADVAWGLFPPFLALVLGGATVAPDWEHLPRAALVLVLVIAWGVRLALHIGRRVASHDEEDKRYAAFRTRFGRHWVAKSIGVIFVPQALLGVVITQPVLIAVTVHRGDSRLCWLDAIATVLVLGGTLLEAIADRQLRRFLARRAAGTEQRRYLTSGVWSWSRHPNYAGDAITWFGFGLFGIAGACDAGEPWLSIPAVLGPVVMAYFLRFGSGVPMTERGRAGHPEWDAYVERTSPFFPRPPRRRD
ncbi:MAG: hypothetical protein JWM86_2519 [Thermoleophilia bacterium]|nr:hypothetical protein [Thermoleophilia bacterium]